MYCPQCSQPITDDLQFCPKCGCQVDGVRRLLGGGAAAAGREAGLAVDARAVELSPRQKGVRQGFKLLLLCLVLLPLHFVVEGLLPSVENTNMDELPQFIVDALLTSIMLGGLARMLYAVAFERGAAGRTAGRRPGELSAPARGHALPPPQSIPVTEFVPRRADTGGMVRAPSVTERTTALLDKP